MDTTYTFRMRSSFEISDDSPENTAAIKSALNILLLDPLTPRLRRRIEDPYAQRGRDFDKETVWLWMNVCGHPGRRAIYLSNVFHWIRFLVDDLMLDYLGKPYKIHPYMEAEAEERTTINLAQELLLDEDFVKSKLRQRLQTDNFRTGISEKRRPEELEANLTQDRALVEALFSLTDDPGPPKIIVDKILTPTCKRQILEGMKRSGRGDGLYTKIWRFFFST